MINTEQLKVGDRVMFFPIDTIGTPFTTGIITMKVNPVAQVRTDNGKYIYVRIKELQPLPTKFDGWEEE